MLVVSRPPVISSVASFCAVCSFVIFDFEGVENWVGLHWELKSSLETLYDWDYSLFKKLTPNEFIFYWK